MPNDTHRTDRRKRTGRDDRGHCTQWLRVVTVTRTETRAKTNLRTARGRHFFEIIVRDTPIVYYYNNIILSAGGTFRGRCTYGGVGGSGGFHTTRIGDGGFLATETATRYVPGHTPSSYLYDAAHRTGARRGTVINAPADIFANIIHY